ncbi:hypothetical protein AVEN_71177-1 [Araneus ventricosus]|uniref:Uncharacterized protein n=1 Tax=Araneus ventricosus TaxID=182803 RepID=A0A4Y2PXN7_ARAVE|nr:hypothetical protein AVEN_71177-1 [Araneus ventricosus]
MTTPPEFDFKKLLNDSTAGKKKKSQMKKSRQQRAGENAALGHVISSGERVAFFLRNELFALLSALNLILRRGQTLCSSGGTAALMCEPPLTIPQWFRKRDSEFQHLLWPPENPDPVGEMFVECRNALVPSGWEGGLSALFVRHLRFSGLKSATAYVDTAFLL